MSNQQGRTRKILATTVILGLLAGLATIASFAAFSSTTSNGANDFDSGTVYVTDNDGGSVMYDVATQKPGVLTEKCIKVTYSGTLAAGIKLYGSRATVETLDQYVNLKIEEGTQASSTFPDCTNFTPSGGAPLYNGTVQGFVTTYPDYANGLATTDSGGGNWAANDTRVYRFTVSVQDNNNANGQNLGELSTGNHTFTWEAQNI